MKTPIIYLAGPLGFSEAGRLFNNQVLIPLLEEAGYEVRDPWAMMPHEVINKLHATPPSTERKISWQGLNRIVGKMNEIAIRQSDLIVAVLDGPDVDSGTASEIGFAAALGKTTIGYRGDFRLSSENEGGQVNIQVEHFIELNQGFIATNTDDLREVLKRIRHRF